MNIYRICSLLLAAFIFLAAPLCSFAQVPGYQNLSDNALDNLVAPVALYPDPVLAQVLQSACHPGELQSAWNKLQAGTSADQLSEQQLDPSVIAVAQYPSVIKMMVGQQAWTAQLGQAYSNQPKDLLASVQRLRQKAKQQGNLVSSEQQKVIVEENVISIVPASTEVIYVPTYNPTVVYTQPADPYAPLLAFGAGVAIGSAMNSSSVNWSSGTVVYHGPTYHSGSGSWSRYYGTGSRGYGSGYTASGTGAYGNKWTSNTAAGRTWNGGAWAAHSQSNQWQNGAKTGSYSASAAGPYGSANSRGWGYEKGDNQAGGFSKTVKTPGGVYNIHGAGASSASQSGGHVTASSYTRSGGYNTQSWTGRNGNVSSGASRSGSMFSGAHSGSWAGASSTRGYQSRSSSFSGGAFAGGGFSRGGFGGGGGFHGRGRL